MIERVAGWIDELLSRFVVERRFASVRDERRRFASVREDGRPPASVRDRRLERLLDGAERVSALAEDDWFFEPPLLVPRRANDGLYHGQPTKRIEWDMPVIPAATKLGVTVPAGAPTATLVGARGRAVWILVHGWLGGSLGQNAWDFPTRRMAERLDVAHFTIPGHGSRRVAGRGRWPSFPTRNPLVNACGLAIAVTELRQLVTWLRQQGYERIGVAGTSIGAHLVALLATTAVEIDRVLLDRPLARMSEPLYRAAMRRTHADRSLLEALERIYAPVSPLHRMLHVEPGRIDVLIGHNDRIAGTHAAIELACHFEVRPAWFVGGHVLSVGRRNRLVTLLGQLDTLAELTRR